MQNMKQQQKIKIFDSRIINTSNPMSDKSKLIQSMSNLIHHVSSSRRNQQQIFVTLSIADIKKILANLDDSNQRLRKTTLMLLAQLLHDNVGIQRKFSQLASLPVIPGKIVFSSAFPKSILCDPQALTEVFKIIKDNSNIMNQKQLGIFWYIDGQTKPKILQYGKRNVLNVDPLFCIVGGWLQTDKSGRKQQKLSFPISPTVSLRPFAQTPATTASKSKQEGLNSSNGKARLDKSENVQQQTERQKQKNKDKSRQRQINEFLEKSEMKTPSKSSTGEELMTQSTKIRDNYTKTNFENVHKSQIPPLVMRTQIKNISNTDTLYKPPATDRKYFFMSPTNGYDTLRYPSQNDHYQPVSMSYNVSNMGNNNASSAYAYNAMVPNRNPQGNIRMEKVKIIDLTTPSTTVNRSMGQDIRTLINPSKVQFRKG